MQLYPNDPDDVDDEDITEDIDDNECPEGYGLIKFVGCVGILVALAILLGMVLWVLKDLGG